MYYTDVLRWILTLLDSKIMFYLKINIDTFITNRSSHFFSVHLHLCEFPTGARKPWTRDPMYYNVAKLMSIMNGRYQTPLQCNFYFLLTCVHAYPKRGKS